jgi:hypothetical protein
MRPVARISGRFRRATEVNLLYVVAEFSLPSWQVSIKLAAFCGHHRERTSNRYN